MKQLSICTSQQQFQQLLNLNCQHDIIDKDNNVINLIDFNEDTFFKIVQILENDSESITHIHITYNINEYVSVSSFIINSQLKIEIDVEIINNIVDMIIFNDGLITCNCIHHLLFDF